MAPSSSRPVTISLAGRHLTKSHSNDNHGSDPHNKTSIGNGTHHDHSPQGNQHGSSGKTNGTTHGECAYRPESRCGYMWPIKLGLGSKSFSCASGYSGQCLRRV